MISDLRCHARTIGLRAIAVGFGGLLLVGVAGCERDTTVRERMRVTGASTVFPIVQMAGEELRETHDLIVEVQAGGSTRGFEDCVAGRNDMGAMARNPTPEEMAQIITFPIAYDGVGVVVHASNSIRAVTMRDLRRIYRKEVRRWTAFGGRDADIVVVTKAEGHATLETFLAYTDLDRSELEVDVVAGDNAQVIRVVANTEDAIGYVSMGEVMHATSIDMPLRLLELDGVEPRLERVADKTYPMYRTLYLVSREEPRGASRVLLDFLRSERGARIIRRGKYVPLG